MTALPPCLSQPGAGGCVLLPRFLFLSAVAAFAQGASAGQEGAAAARRGAPPLPGFSSPCPGHASSASGPGCWAGAYPKSERAALQKCLDEERAGGGRRTGLELGGARRGQPRGVCPRQGQLGQERARLCAACGPEQSVCSCCFSSFYFLFFGKVGVRDGAAGAAPAPLPGLGIPAGGRLQPRGRNAVTACGRGGPGAGAALPGPSPCSPPPAPLRPPPPPPSPLPSPRGVYADAALCRRCQRGRGLLSITENCVLKKKKKKKSPPPETCR